MIIKRLLIEGIFRDIGVESKIGLLKSIKSDIGQRIDQQILLKILRIDQGKM